MTQTVLRRVRVYDGAGFGEPTEVVIDDGLIGTSTADAAEAPGAAAVAVVDGGNGYLVPGFIDTHVHLAGIETLEALAAHGVTTALDMGSPVPLVDSLRGLAGLTDIRSSGFGATSPTSAHAARLQAGADCLVATPVDAEPFVARRVAQGADHIKIVIDLPGFEQATVDAIVAAAHRRDLLVVAHASRLDAVTMAQRAKVDVLTHVPLDRPVDSAQAASLTHAGAVVSPTLVMMRAMVDRLAVAGRPGPSYEPARASLACLHAAGMPVACGTDANANPAVPASPPFGSSLHDELELLVDAGLSPVEALNAATSVAARVFGLSDRGAIAPGLRADLVLLADDPTRDIRASRSIRDVWCGGVRRA